MSKKALIIRFSSFGDIVQAMSVPPILKKTWGDIEIHWVTRSDFADFLYLDPSIDRIWSFDKKSGFGGLKKLSRELKAQNFDYVYDAHNNLRSFFLCLWLGRPQHFLRRSKNRLKRFLLFSLRINLFEKPFVAVKSFTGPLKAWGISSSAQTLEPRLPPVAVQKAAQLIPSWNQYVLLAPSAAWEVKRWPIGHWRSLIYGNPTLRFVIVGGPKDHFCSLIQEIAADRAVNLAGKTSLIETAELIRKAAAVVSADTGTLHLADLLGRPTVALIGPTAFGYPFQKSSAVLEIDLRCRPCSKDGSRRCTNRIYQQCMVDISPSSVSEKLTELLIRAGSR